MPVSDIPGVNFLRTPVPLGTRPANSLIICGNVTPGNIEIPGWNLFFEPDEITKEIDNQIRILDNKDYHINHQKQYPSAHNHSFSTSLTTNCESCNYIEHTTKASRAGIEALRTVYSKLSFGTTECKKEIDNQIRILDGIKDYHINYHIDHQKQYPSAHNHSFSTSLTTNCKSCNYIEQVIRLSRAGIEALRTVYSKIK